MIRDTSADGLMTAVTLALGIGLFLMLIQRTGVSRLVWLKELGAGLPNVAGHLRRFRKGLVLLQENPWLIWVPLVLFVPTAVVALLRVAMNDPTILLFSVAWVEISPLSDATTGWTASLFLLSRSAFLPLVALVTLFLLPHLWRAWMQENRWYSATLITLAVLVGAVQSVKFLPQAFEWYQEGTGTLFFTVNTLQVLPAFVFGALAFCLLVARFLHGRFDFASVRRSFPAVFVSIVLFHLLWVFYLVVLSLVSLHPQANWNSSFVEGVSALTGSLSMVLGLILAPLPFIAVMESCGFARALGHTFRFYARRPAVSIAFLIFASAVLWGGLFLGASAVENEDLPVRTGSTLLTTVIRGLYLVLSSALAVTLLQTLRDTRDDWREETAFQFTLGHMLAGVTAFCVLAVLAFRPY